MTNQLMCEACLTAPLEREVPSEVLDRPFRLCQPCAHRLENLALRPLEWYRLSAKHGPLTFLLHDDFYDQDGKADQNKIPVKQASIFPVPKLTSVQDKLCDLLDYAITRWHLAGDVVEALNAHSQEEVLSALPTLVENRPIVWVETRSYEIAASVLGSAAEDWIRSRWESGTRLALLPSFMKAVAACMPHQEAVPLALAAVEASGVRDLTLPAMSLVSFRSPQVVDWIERKAVSPISDRWGRIAIRSGLRWETAVRWLEAGRPLSLIATDALGLAMRPKRSRGFSTLPEIIENAPPREEMLKALREYARHDPVPRVTQMIKRIEQYVPD